MASSTEMAEAVKNSVKIPDYFDKVIVPAMSSYYGDNTPDFELRPVCCCPLHNEDTPSFRYYDYSNSFYCFGCGIGGDVVQLHREFMRVNYNQHISFGVAVRQLYNGFILGKVQTKTRKTHTKSEEQESSNIELMRYGLARKNMEDSLIVDKITPIRVKTELYAKLDQLDRLVELKMLNATYALDILDRLKCKQGAAKIRAVSQV